MSVTNLVTPAMLQTLKDQLFDEEYPVGSHKVQFDGEEPPASRRGTWAIDSDYEGRVVIGSGGSYALGATGGNAGHQHTYSVAYSEFYGALSGTDSAIQLNEQWSSSFLQSKVIPRNSSFQTAMSSQEITTRVVWGNTGETPSLPRYKVIAVWKRVA